MRNTMGIDNNWYNDIVKEIDKHKGRFTRRDYKKYKLDLLLRVAKRVASFSVDCPECQNFQIEIKKHAENLDDLVQSSKEERKSYSRTIDNAIKHLQEHHKRPKSWDLVYNWIIDWRSSW